MSDDPPSDSWRSETAGDLRSAEELLESTRSAISGEPSNDQVAAIWRAYLLVEKSVAFIKVELDEENPGRFVNAKVYDVPDERQAIGFALKFLKRASEAFAAGDLAVSLKTLRESRNYLRVLLRRKRLMKMRRARSAA